MATCFGCTKAYGLMMVALVEPKHVDMYIYYKKEPFMDGL